MLYFVVGGEYGDRTFASLVRRDPIDGPFVTYDEAYDAWRCKSVPRVDRAFVRYPIVQAHRREDAESLAA
jgi:hypothetical protein